MKKMICEICGSQSIKKENDIFVCKECGTEYSIDDAKQLLKDVVETDNNTFFSTTKTQSKRMILLQNLLSWLVYINDIESSFSDYFEIDLTLIRKDEAAWIQNVKRIF